MAVSRPARQASRCLPVTPGKSSCRSEERLRLAIEALRERQECELINNGESGPRRTGLPEGQEPGLPVRFMDLSEQAIVS
ncbi:hypothetical protein [Streptomyces chattanoogensis]|uniref:Type 2A encapsulin shell protein SrpI-like domain-containing protein n=1 Tax=Streptomyces chattanoogensis TaxID=66876 RepID=A0A0N0GZK3_9ACTN|nr:hypothetical protein [Streptomyces chattanoogensis]KPC62812.1 hypothetical protein ADL29_17650 [Streptomyces chattanoogensis]